MKMMRVRWNHVSLVGFPYEKNILLEVCVSNPLKEYVIHIVQTVERSRRFKPTLHEKCPNTKFSRIRAEYGEMRSISPYSVRMRENTYQKKLRIWTLFMRS